MRPLPLAGPLILLLHLSCAAQTTNNSPPEPVVPVGGAVVTIVQRQSVDFPAKRPVWRIAIGDITAGQTLITVRALDGSVLLEQISISEGQSRQFQYDGLRYQVTAERLVNLITGDDFAEISIKPDAAPDDRQRMNAAIERVRASGLTFIRNGKQHSSAAAADHMAQKLKNAGGRVKTWEQFLDHIVSRSSVSGEPYEVILPDGKRMLTRDWITQSE